ncbi:SgcJ/EcaC family oxidoreductase [soil metagenome]
MDITQVRALIDRQARAWERADIDVCVADFAADALFISPGGRWQGQEAIRATVKGFFAGARDVKVEITRVIVDGNQGAVEWTWSEFRLSDGKRHVAEDAIIFELQDNKIVYWREYFDMATF